MAILDWLRSNETLIGWLVFSSVVMFTASLLIIPILIAKMRPDYFTGPNAGHTLYSEQHWLIAGIGLVIKNLVGGMLLLAGIAMLVLPGQGLITMFMGITLLNFPGKRNLELRIMRQKHVRAGVDWIRRRAGSPPLQMPRVRARNRRPED